MTLVQQIKATSLSALQTLYPDASFDISQIAVNQTKPEFSGHYTVVLFPFVKSLRCKPNELGEKLGEYLVQHTSLFDAHQTVSGFLNLSIKDSVFTNFLLNHFNDTCYGTAAKNDTRVMVEYSSPNTNKPLHFGHLRNNFLGFAVSNILKADGQQVVMANLVNDRGIHICKSMVAWQQFGNGATPESTGIKGDHLVGDYYVRFNDEYKKQIAALVADGKEQAVAEKEAPIMQAAQNMLRDWEKGDEKVRELWSKMNGWVYTGFDKTYARLGISFDKYYYESETYLLGKKIVEEGLERGVLFKKVDGSVWVDLTDEGLDQKLLLRGDGTSVYITQDLGTAKLKYEEYKLDQSIYVIADEQNYHMQVLQLIMKKLGEPAWQGIRHLSYGMVELPSGKMKSREGTVVDADDMIDEMIALAKEQTEAAGKTEGFSAEELQALYEMIGIGALKFYLLRVEPKKKMIFDPKESIDLHGYTATFIQYAHARICSILRREDLPLMPDTSHFQSFSLTEELTKSEGKLLLALEQFPEMMKAAAVEYSPSVLCNYAFSLAQLFNSFYDDHPIAKAATEEKKNLRLMIIVMTAQVLRHAMKLLGIRLPEKM
ncbi:MAG: arginine--tRNA ligase [Chitinophagaceae bacterium]